MVNGPATNDSIDNAPSGERRERARAAAVGAAVPAGASLVGPAKLHPFGDLHTLQHLSARLARVLRGRFENYWRGETRTWAEPLEVVRFADYRAARGDVLTAWATLTMDGGPALMVVDGRFVLELLDLFFGGTGVAPAELPGEFTPAAEALVLRIAADVAGAMEATWEPVARARFATGRVESNARELNGIDAEDPVVVTRFGLVRGETAPVMLDLVYPVSTLKPHGTQLTGKVVAKPAEVNAEWQTELTRAAMTVRFPVRSVLAEPVVPLRRLMDLKAGDVIPIHFTNDVPVMIGRTLLGTGTVGTSNGHAAIRLSTLEDITA